jgi:acetate CoA/acetoacetate CoA-transferase alpha subunit
MKAAIPADRAAAIVPDGASLLIGGFMGVGSPHRLIDALVKRGAKDLTVIANDTAMPGRGELSPIFGDGLKDQAAAVWD